MTNLKPVEWSAVADVSWELIDGFEASEDVIRAAGLGWTRIDDDGLEYDVVAVRLSDGRLAMIGQGVGGPAGAWTVGRVRGSDLSADEVFASLRASGADNSGSWVTRR